MRPSGVEGGSGLDMSPEAMRALGHQVVDLLVERWTGLEEGAAWKGGERWELEPLLAGMAPEEGADAQEVLAKIVEEILPRAGRIDHPRFFAFIPSSPTWPSVMGDLLATGHNVFQGTWLESAGPSQLELVVLEWFRAWLGLPTTGGGLLTSGGSVANLIAVVTARESAGNPPGAVVYVSDQGHSSLERAARVAGIPRDNLRRIPTDASFRMDVGALGEAIRSDRARGLHPLLVCGNAGATNTGAVDPLEGIGRLAREEEVWFHVDGAYGGFAVLVPEGRVALKGIEEADSITLDPHKWLFQPYETGCLMVRDTRNLEEAFRILPEYLQDTQLGLEHVNFADRGIQLTRRFRALKIWMSIQMLGLGAFRGAIATSIRLAGDAAERVKASPSLELTAPRALGVVCFRYLPPGLDLEPSRLESLNRTIQEKVVASGLAMISSTRLRGIFSLRLCIMNYRSRWEDVRAVLEAVEEIGGNLVAAGLGR